MAKKNNKNELVAIKGYKAFHEDMTCRNMKYEIGETYEMEGEPIICKRGFHFCKTIADCYKFYNCSNDTIICEILALGAIVSDGNDIKFCTNRIKIVKKIRNPRVKTNSDSTSTGFCNFGYYNIGNYNSGDFNTGSENSGNYNTGECNSGNLNSGNFNRGNRNSGIGNQGIYNSGDKNAGSYNTGKYNVGDYNTGDFNYGNYNCGVFCTENPKIKLFDKESPFTIHEWRRSRAYEIMHLMPISYCCFVEALDMTKEEKEKHPEYKLNNGYVKYVYKTNSDRQYWWNNSLSKEERETILKLPNFDAGKFFLCTGIDVNEKREER